MGPDIGDDCRNRRFTPGDLKTWARVSTVRFCFTELGRSIDHGCLKIFPQTLSSQCRTETTAMHKWSKEDFHPRCSARISRIILLPIARSADISQLEQAPVAPNPFPSFPFRQFGGPTKLLGLRGVRRCFECRSRSVNIVQPATDIVLSVTASFNPFVNSFQPRNTRRRKTHSDHLLSTSPSQTTPNNDRLQPAVYGAVGFLHQEYESRLQASDQFPLDITPSYIRASIARYESHMSVQSQEGICSCCGRFVPTEEIHRLLAEDPLLY